MTEYQNQEGIKKLVGTGSINIFGRPFSGKDTQGRRLADLINGVFLSSGQLIRDSKSELSTRKGHLTPSEDFFDIVLPVFSNADYVNLPLVLSSIGRWHGEEESVISSLEQAGHPLKAVVYLDISTDESRKRWHNLEILKDREGRKDDSLEVLETRFKEFDSKTLPVLDYYRSKGLLIEVDGTGDRDKITQDILNHLIERLAS